MQKKLREKNGQESSSRDNWPRFRVYESSLMRVSERYEYGVWPESSKVFQRLMKRVLESCDRRKLRFSCHCCHEFTSFMCEMFLKKNFALQISILNSKVEQQPSFLDYIRGG
jgi:hypothetical protein